MIGYGYNMAMFFIVPTTNTPSRIRVYLGRELGLDWICLTTTHVLQDILAVLGGELVGCLWGVHGCCLYIDGLAQDCGNSIAKALELVLCWAINISYHVMSMA